MSRVLLADIERLTFHKGEKTKGRRLPPIQQLKCVGSPCKLFEPEVVRCHNIGGQGSEVDWTCEADLPEKLRFGRVDVSCEGWSEAGDPYVTKGSCGLVYRLVRLPDPATQSSLHSNTIATVFFSALLLGILIFILYGVLRDCCGQTQRRTSSNNPRPSNGPTFRSGGTGPDAPPPPYRPFDEKNDNNYQQPPQSSNSDFMRGAALGAAGGAAALAAAQAIRRNMYNPEYRTYDWEQTEQPREQPRRTWRDNNRGSDRGEGSSSLGQLRASTGFGTSTVR